MNLTNKYQNYAKLLILLGFALAVFAAGVIFSAKGKAIQNLQNESMTNVTEEKRTERKEYLYRLLTNTTRSLIQMEIKARRLEENMRRIKEKTADLLYKNKDKALWHILFKNISRHISIRHEFHQHSSLRRIMQDSHAHGHRRRKLLLFGP